MKAHARLRRAWQVAEVLRGSATLVVAEDGRRVRRTLPLESPEEVARQVDERSLYAAPFPYTATLDDLMAFFGARAPVNCVRQRRHLASKDFKGSCFVEFADVEAATQARWRPQLPGASTLHGLWLLHVSNSACLLHAKQAPAGAVDVPPRDAGAFPAVAPPCQEAALWPPAGAGHGTGVRGRAARTAAQAGLHRQEGRRARAGGGFARAGAAQVPLAQHASACM